MGEKLVRHREKKKSDQTDKFTKMAIALSSLAIVIIPFAIQLHSSWFQNLEGCNLYPVATYIPANMATIPLPVRLYVVYYSFQVHSRLT